MEPIVVLISLILYGIGLKVIRVFFQDNLTPIVFYIGYNFALFQRLIETRLVKSGSAIVLYLGFFVLRVTVISDFNIPALMIQILLEVLLLISNVERERNIRRIFKSFYDYKVSLLKFKDLITNYFPENIVIFNKDFSKTLFTNETFQRSFFDGFFDKNIDDSKKDEKIFEMINTFKIDEETIQGIDLKEPPTTLGRLLKNFPHDDDNGKILTVNIRKNEAKPNDMKQVYQTKILKLFWDQDEANAVIFSDLTQQETIIALKIADANKDKVLATVSHELRSPINVILGFYKILDGLVGHDPQVKFYLSACKYSADWLLTLVNSILDLTQIRAKSIKLNPVAFDLRQNLEEIKRMFSFQCSQKGLELVFDVDSDLPRTIFTDKNRLNQILINLLYNALKFTYKGSIKLKVRNSKTNLTRLKFRVTDTGIGIKDEDKEKLFKMYGKVEQSDSKINTQGVGLGLTISNELVRLLNPNKDISGIKCKSEFKQGSSFSFSIVKNLNELSSYLNSQETKTELIEERPVLAVNRRGTIFPPEKEYKFMPMSSPNLSCGGRNSIIYHHSPDHSSFITHETPRISFLHAQNKSKSLVPTTTTPSTKSHLSFPLEDRTYKPNPNSPWTLVVDDMPFNLIVASHLLKKKGFNIKTALNGEEAIKVVTEHYETGKEFKLVLMDCQMPVMDGFEATEILVKMMEMKKIGKIPIVAFSANNSKKDIERAKKSGMCEFLIKPLEDEQFDSVLNDLKLI